MKINFACGRQTWPGYFCIDAQHNPKASRPVDLLYAFEFEGTHIKQPIPVADNCTEEIFCGHFIEHVFRWEANAVIEEFRRLLKPGGRLILELPDIRKACKNLLKGMDDQMSMWPLYGDWSHQDPLMMHKHGYTPETVTALLRECSMRQIRFTRPQTKKRRTNRDMRVESIK